MEEIKTALSAQTREEILAQTAKLSEECTAIVVQDEQTAERARELMKECTKVANYIETKRKEYTTPLDDLKKSFMEAEKELVKPVDEAKQLIQKKQLDYANEVERKRLEEEKKILDIISGLNAITDETDFELAACDYEPDGDTRILVAIQQRRNFFSEQKRMADLRKQQAEEQKRLDKIAAEQGAEAARLAEEEARIARRKKEAEDEAERIREDARQKELERQREEDEKKSAKSSSTGGVKGIRTVKKFEIINTYLIPREYLSPDESKIREAIKTIDLIPGIRIYEEKKVS